MESITEEKQDCLFCQESFYKDRVIFENKCWYAVLDGYPVAPWHTLIIPKRHVESIFKINLVEFLQLSPIIMQVKKILSKNAETEHFNIGVNDGEYAGQTIPHLHIHIIPRHKDDGGLPCGVRNVFPQEIANYKEKSDKSIAI